MAESLTLVQAVRDGLHDKMAADDDVVVMGATLEDVAGTIHTHPTLSEAVMEAAENALGQAIHVRNR
ncbi:MAG: hypothetical protein ABEJ76_00705 [Halanaeroarchaeum sp.]